MDVVAWIKTIIFRSYEIQNQAELTYSNISQKSGSLGGGGGINWAGRSRRALSQGSAEVFLRQLVKIVGFEAVMPLWQLLK